MLILMPFILILPFELIHVVEYDGYTTLAAFSSSIETNYGEASEFLHDYRHYLFLTTPFQILALLAFFLIPRHISVNRTGKIAISAVFTLTCALFSTKTFLDTQETILTEQEKLYARLLSENYPFSYAVKTTQYIDQIIKMRLALAEKANFQFNIQMNSSADKLPDVIVLVIGESSRAINWSLNGYQRDTNPLLSQRHDIINFTHAITAATTTRQSVLLSLTRATPENLTPLTKEKSLIQAFREAEYKTFWLSNQNKLGAVDTPITALANEADVTRFTNVNYMYNPAYDEIMFPMFEQALTDPASKKLIILHTLGSHEVYRMRYPPGFERFKPSSKGDDYNFSSPGIKERLVNSYDNSILYTDFVINSFIDILASRSHSSVMLYFSDHGENLLDDGNMRFGHGGVMPTNYVIHIPMLAWMSKQYHQEHTDKFMAFSKNKDNLISLNSLFDTTLDLASLEIPQQAQNYSIARYPGKSPSSILNPKYDAIPYSKIETTDHAELPTQ
ncbi:MAG: phosphoethanolamine transferase [Gammaproteobacteria bacterium]|nr:phosphoethanolamine transferase [Gammaproteobacteria bacterium]